MLRFGTLFQHAFVAQLCQLSKFPKNVAASLTNLPEIHLGLP